MEAATKECKNAVHDRTCKQVEITAKPLNILENIFFTSAGKLPFDRLVFLVCCWFGAALLWDGAPFAGLLECVSQYISNQNAFAQRLTAKHQRNKFCCNGTTPLLLKSAANRSLTSAALQAGNLPER